MKEISSTGNRSAILACALTLFAQRGYDAVGVREIVEQVGITKPTLYHYFTSKKGLLQVLLDEKFSPFLVRLASTTNYQGDLPLSLQQLVVAYFQFARQEPEFYQLLISLETAPIHSEAYQLATPFLMRQQHLLESLFQQAVADHGACLARYGLTELNSVRYPADAIRKLLNNLPNRLFSNFLMASIHN